MIFSSWKVEGGELVRTRVQPERDAIMNFTAELRKNPGALRDLSSMGWALCIPDIDLELLWKKYPELNASDAPTRRAAWVKFMRSSEADPYRVKPRVSHRGKRASTAALFPGAMKL